VVTEGEKGEGESGGLGLAGWDGGGRGTIQMEMGKGGEGEEFGDRDQGRGGSRVDGVALGWIGSEGLTGGRREVISGLGKGVLVCEVVRRGGMGWGERPCWEGSRGGDTLSLRGRGNR